ncbi:hypothetical protein ACFGVR_01245 [Mucilaginibacter sp. AW1-3]
MSEIQSNPDQPGSTSQKPKPWSWLKKFGFRVLFVFLLAMCIPFTGSWYKNVYTLNWFRPHYRDIYDIARFQPSFQQFFGGKGEYGDADALPGNNANTEPKSTGHKDSAQLLGTDDQTGKKHHRHDSDSTEVNNGAFGGHHHDGRDSTLVNNDGKHHHRHHGDSVLATGETLVTENAPHKHHHQSRSTTVDSAKHDSTKVAAVVPVHHKKNDNGDQTGALPPKRNFFADYTDWGIAFLIGIAGALIWSIFDRKSESYNILYYWIRVVVRYRAGIGIIGFGFTKLFPTQMPYPSLGLLNSNFGDFTAQKIYWMSVGIVPWYQVFGGVVEIVAGTLLLFRKTTLYGAILLAGALGDITFVNYAYDGGVHVYAFYFVFLSLFLIADDVPKLYNLLIRERYTVPFHVYPDFKKTSLKYARVGLKALTFLIFFVILTYTEIVNFKYDPYKQPSTAGVKQLRGNYHVTEFKINGQEIAYNPLDSVRWQEATFENWTTLTFRVNHPVVIDPSNGGGSPMKDIQRTFEITGVAGGERAFHYLADTVDKVLYLQDKNIVGSGGRRGGRGNRNKAKQAPKPNDNWIGKEALAHIGDEKNMIDTHAFSARRDREFADTKPEPKRNRMVLNYQTTDGSHVILSGINERRDSIYVVLDRYDRKYALPKSTLVAGKY